MTTKKQILIHPLVTGIFYPLIILIVGGIIMYSWQSNKEKKIKNEDTQNSRVESLERYRIVDSMEHRTFNARIRKLENKP
jgi:hypothetical protein